MNNTAPALDMNQFPAILQQIQQQLTLVTEKGQAPSHNSTASGSTRNDGDDRSAAVNSALTNGVTSFAKIATAAAHKPDPKKKEKKRLAAGRAFTTAKSKGAQGFQYVYIGRSRKIQRSEVRKHLTNANIDVDRILDICFPASHVIGILLHVQYVQEFTELLNKAKGKVFTDFDPLDPENVADPEYKSLPVEQRQDMIAQYTEACCLQTLSYIRPLNVSGVGKYFVEKGWICDDGLSTAVAAALKRFSEKEPKKADFLFRRKHNPASDTAMNDLETDQ